MGKLLSDEEVFGAGSAPALMSDEDVFGGGVANESEPPKRGIMDVIKDVGVSFAGGANALLETGGNLAGLVGVADMDNWAAKQGESGKKYWDEQKSSGLKADEAERRAAIDSADGQWSKAGTAFWETIKNPALLSSFAAEQVPMFLPIGMAGRAGAVASMATGAAGKTANVAGKVAGKVGTEGIAARIAQKGLAGISTAEKAAGAIGTTTGIGAGALLQGADVGGDTYNDVLKLPQSLWEHNAEYQSLRMQVGDQPAKEAIAHDLAQQAATEGGVASVLTNLLPFARTFERATAGAPTKLKGNIVARGIKGFAGESLQEASEEGWGKVASNRAAQEIDASRGLEEGVGEAAGMGAVGGGVMGGAMGMASKEDVPLAPPGSLTSAANIAAQQGITPASVPPEAIDAADLLGTPEAATPLAQHTGTVDATSSPVQNVAPPIEKPPLAKPASMSILDGVTNGATSRPASPALDIESATSASDNAAGSDANGVLQYDAATQEVLDAEARREQAGREEHAQILRDAAARSAIDQADINERTTARVSNSDNFQFGESSKQAAAPVADLFNQPDKPTAPNPQNNVGDLVKLTKPGLNGRVNIAGTISKILPDGRLEIKTQQDGYMTVAASELGHKPVEAESSTAEAGNVKQDDHKSFADFFTRAKDNAPIDKYDYERELRDLADEIKRDWSMGNSDDVTGSFGPDEIHAQLKQEDASRYYDEDGDLTDDGGTRYNELEERLAMEAAKSAITPKRKEVSASRPDHIAQQLAAYLETNGIDTTPVGGSGKSSSQYFGIISNGRNISVRVSDHPLPSEYQGSDEELVLADETDDMRADGRIASEGLDKDEALQRANDFAKYLVGKYKNAATANSLELGSEATDKTVMQKRTMRANNPVSSEPAQSDVAVGGKSNIPQQAEQGKPEEILIKQPYNVNTMAGIDEFEQAKEAAASAPGNTIVRVRIEKEGLYEHEPVKTLYGAFVANGDGTATWAQARFPASKENPTDAQIMELAEADRLRNKETEAKIDEQARKNKAALADKGIVVGLELQSPSTYVPGKKGMTTFTRAKVVAIDGHGIAEVHATLKGSGKTYVFKADANSRLFEKLKSKPAQEQQATAILDRANVTGKDRLDIMRDFKDGKHTLDDLEAAYPAKDAEMKQSKSEQPASVEGSNTEDAGAELTYNKRNRMTRGIKWEDIADKNESLRVKEVTKAKVYPKPDYEAIIAANVLGDEQLNKIAAHLVKQVYDSISAKPQTRTATDEQLQEYITGVNRVMDGVMSWANNREQVADLIRKVSSRAQNMRGGMMSISALAEQAPKALLEMVYPNGYKAYGKELQLIGGNKPYGALQPGVDSTIKAMNDIEKGWPAAQESWQRQGFAITPKENVEFSFYDDTRTDGTPYSALNYRAKGQRSGYKTLTGATIAEARAAAEEYRDSIGDFVLTKKNGDILGSYATEEEATEAARAAVKREAKADQISEKGWSVAAAERIGVAHRMEGENIDSDKLKETFGFKGVNFGNWMKGETKSNVAERQAHLNHAYDAFLDLAEIVGVPPKAMSLNGMLGLAIGAQGSGKNLAHFVPGVNEINLTRTGGAGALAHEWAHALDHYFATLAGLGREKEPFLTVHVGRGDDSGYTKRIVDGKSVKVKAFSEELRPEVLAQFKAIVQAMTKKMSVAPTEEEAKAQTESRIAREEKNVESWLKAIRRDFEISRVEADKKAALLGEFDALAARIRNNDVGDGLIAASTSKSLYPVIAEMRDAYKKAAGRVYSLDQAYGLHLNVQSLKHSKDGKYANAEHVPRLINSDYQNASLRADKETQRNYWATKLEMFARAFDAYVVDTLAEKSAKNSYLSGIEAVAPAGEERKAIGKAFDFLLAELKTKETDKGVALFSRGEQVGGQTVASVTKSTAQLRARWLGFRRVKIVQSVREVPNEIYLRALRALKPIDQGTEGFYDPKTNTVYLIADNIASSERAAWVAIHEVVGHGGVRMLDRSVAEALEFAGKNGFVQKLAKAIAVDRGETFNAKMHTDEALAELAAATITGETDAILSRYGVKVPMGMRSNLLGMIKRVVDAVRNFIGSVTGKPVDEVSDGEVLGLIRRMKNVVEGAEQAAVEQGEGYALASVPASQEKQQPRILRMAKNGSMEADTSLIDKVVSAPFKLAGWNRIVEPALDRLLDRAGEFVPEKVKAGLVSDYGLGAEYIDRKAEMKASEAAQNRKSAGLVEMLAALTRAESRVAYQWMQEKPDTVTEQALLEKLPEESRETLARLKKMISDMGKEAVHLGQMSQDAYQRNNMAYLHRTYAKHVLNNEGAIRKMLRARALKIKGNQYKGRGIFDEVRMDAVGAEGVFGRKLQQGQADKSLVGEKLIRFERRDDSTDAMDALPGITKKPMGKLREVAYWPASTPVPQKFGNWVNSGTFEVRDTKGDKLVVWRDFTPDERERMGELDEVRYAVAQTLQMMTHDIEVGRFFAWTAKTYGKAKPEGRETTASESMLHSFGKDEWVQVPSAVIPGTQTKKYGALAGLYIPGAVWNDIRQTAGTRIEPFGHTHEKVLQFWKKAKTAWSPAVHMNNVMANFVIADWHDLRAADLAEALKVWAYNNRDGYREIYHRFEDSGALGGMFLSNEALRDEIAKQLELIKEELTGEQEAKNEMTRMAKVMHLVTMVTTRLPEGIPGAKLYASKMEDAYQFEDAIFRLAAFTKAIRYGKSDIEAGRIARHSFLNYDINAPWIQAARHTALPFVSFFYRALPMALNTVKSKPWKVVKLMAFWHLISMLGYLGSGDDDEDKAARKKREEEERALLPKEKQGSVWGVVPKMVRMPWNHDDDAPYFLDIRRWVPVGDVADIEMGAGMLPPWATPGGPLIMLAEMLVANKSFFTEKEIVLDTDTQGEKLEKRLDHLFKGMLPNVPLPNPLNLQTPVGEINPLGLNQGSGQSYAWSGIEKSMLKREGSIGEVRNTPAAIASAFGIKASAYPAGNMQAAQQIELLKKVGEIQDSMNKVQRNFNNLEDPTVAEQARYERDMDRQRAKLEEVVQEGR